MPAEWHRFSHIENGHLTEKITVARVRFAIFMLSDANDTPNRPYSRFYRQAAAHV